MKKKVVIEAFIERSGRIYSSKKANKELIRRIADYDECFDNLVFELGCDVLDKAIRKRIEPPLSDGSEAEYITKAVQSIIRDTSSKCDGSGMVINAKEISQAVRKATNDTFA